MEKYSFGNALVELDQSLTAKWYAQSKGWGCECSHCRNFLELARNRALPKNMLDILDTLGLSPEKATYVGELFTDEAGIHYQFSYRIAGTILDLPNTDNPTNCTEVRCCHEPYPYGAPDFPDPHFDLEFYATLPWVLEDSQG